MPHDVTPSPLALHSVARYVQCLKGDNDTDATPCVFGDTARARTLVVFGDSHAMQWMPALDSIAKATGYRLLGFYKIVCPVPDVPVVYRSFGPYTQCREVAQPRARRDSQACIPTPS